MVGLVMTNEKVELLVKVSVLVTIVYVHHHHQRTPDRCH